MAGEIEEQSGDELDVNHLIEDDDFEDVSIEMVQPCHDDELDFDDVIEDDDSEDVNLETGLPGWGFETRSIELTLPRDSFEELDRLLAGYHKAPMSLGVLLERLAMRSADGFRQLRTGQGGTNTPSHQHGNARKWLQQALGSYQDRTKGSRRSQRRPR